MKKKMLATLLTAAMAASALAGCGGSAKESAPAAVKDETTAEAPAGSASEAETSADNSGGAVTLKLFSNLPDRKNGQGLV